MSVGRPHAFALDDAALSAGAIVASAGSGLPRRITGGIDYEARVMALGPSGYWPLNEASGSFLDRTTNARHLTHTAGVIQRAQSGCGIGGSAGLSVQSSNGYDMRIGAAALYPEHTLVPSSGFACFAWLWISDEGINAGNGTLLFRTNDAGTTILGWAWYTSATAQTLRIKPPGALAQRFAYGAAAAKIYDNARWVPVAVRHVAGATRFMVGGEWFTYNSGNALTDPGGGSYPLLVGGGFLISDVARRWQHMALWAGSGIAVPSEAQLTALATGVACGTARWTLPVDATQARTLKGWQLPGRLARADLTRLGVRSYYQIGAGARTEFDPGDDLSIAIPAGSACYLDADLTHHHLDDLPWIADSLGGGPVALYEEADPAPVPVDVTAIHSRAGAIEITTSAELGTIAAPTSDASPAIHLGAPTKAGAVLTLPHDGAVYVAQPRAALVRHTAVVSATPRPVRVIHARRPTTVNP